MKNAKKNKNFFIALLILGVFALLFLIRIFSESVQTQTSPKTGTSVQEKNVQRNEEIVPTAKSEIQKENKELITNSREITTYSSAEGYSFRSVPGWYLREFGSLYPRNLEFIAISPQKMVADDIVLVDAKITIQVSEKAYETSLEARSHYTSLRKNQLL